MKTYKGVDLSQYNQNSNFAEAKKNGLDFIIARAVSTRNSIYIDSKFNYHYLGAKENNIKFGAYLYTYATSKSQLKKEIAVLDTALNGRLFDYPIIIDIEDPLLNKASLRDINTENVLYFADYYKNKGFNVAFYTMPSFYLNALNMDKLRNIDFWIAHWTHSTAKESIYISKNKNTKIWQLTDRGRFAGVGETGSGLDLNISYKDYTLQKKDTTDSAILTDIKDIFLLSYTDSTDTALLLEAIEKYFVKGQFILLKSGAFDFKGLNNHSIINFGSATTNKSAFSMIPNPQYYVNTKKDLEILLSGQKNWHQLKA